MIKKQTEKQQQKKAHLVQLLRESKMGYHDMLEILV